MALLIPAAPPVRVTVVAPQNGRTFTLPELQRFVGGYIELVRVDEEQLMFINEEGKLKDLPPNAYATALLRVRGRLFPGDYIAGDAVICTRTEAGEDEEER